MGVPNPSYLEVVALSLPASSGIPTLGASGSPSLLRGRSQPRHAAWGIPVKVRDGARDATAAEVSGHRGSGLAAVLRDERLWLVLVALAYACASWTAGRHLGVGRDEAVYISQVSPFKVPAYFSAPRSRGITWLVAPWVHHSDSTLTLRAYLAVLSGTALTIACWPWLRLRGLAGRGVVALAAGLFSTLWVSRFYATAVMPNLWVGFGALASCGFLLRLAETNGRGRWALLAGWAGGLALIGIMRPSDCALVAVVEGLAAAILMRRRAAMPIFVAVVACLASVTPWVLEANARFGGVSARLARSAATEGGLGMVGTPATMLKVMNGPLLCRPTCRQMQAQIPASAIWLWAAALCLTGIGLAWAVRAHRIRMVAVPVLVAGALALFYIYGLDYGAPRFLLPAYAVGSVPVAAGLVAIVAAVRGPARMVLLATAAGLVLALASQQNAALHHEVGFERPRRAIPAMIAKQLSAAGIRPGCMVSGAGAPMIAFSLGCASSALSGHDTSLTRPELIAMAGSRQVVLSRRLPNTVKPPAWARRIVGPGFPAPVGRPAYPAQRRMIYLPIAISRPQPAR